MFKDEKLKFILCWLGASILLITLIASKLVPMNVITALALIIIGMALIFLGIE